MFTVDSIKSILVRLKQIRYGKITFHGNGACSPYPVRNEWSEFETKEGIGTDNIA